MSDDDDELADVPALEVPEYHLSDEEVEETEFTYSTRAPEDWVISGPLGSLGGGPGRRFAHVKQAEAWARDKYGTRLKGRIPEATLNNGNRWAFLVRGECTKQQAK